jgi:hypothetical protein
MATGLAAVKTFFRQTVNLQFLALMLAATPDLSAEKHAEVNLAEETISLFDGQTFDGWVAQDDKPITQGWEVVDGTIHLKVGKERAGFIKTTRTFENFILEFEWRIAEGGNSGVKYLAKESDSKFGVKYFGCEFQILDDNNHKNGRTLNKTAGALYNLSAPVASQKQLKPLGEFNRSKVVVDNGHLEHWLNGRKIVEATIGSEDWLARVEKSKVSSVKDFANGPGVILLQEHLSEAWFRNIRITPLPKIDVSSAAAFRSTTTSANGSKN